MYKGLWLEVDNHKRGPIAEWSGPMQSYNGVLFVFMHAFTTKYGSSTSKT